MDDKYLMIREALLEYIARTGQKKADTLLIIHPETVIVPEIAGKLPTKILGVEVVENDLVSENGFLLIPRDEIDNIDDLILELLEPEEDPINCGECGHPIALEMAGDLDFAVCPWCNKKNVIEF